MTALASLGAIVSKYWDRDTGAPPATQTNYVRESSLPSPSIQPSISGTYNGRAFNQTVGASGNVRLVINELSGKITGAITITGNLGGSGPVEGYTDGHRIGFTSVEQSTGIRISWEGVVIGGEAPSQRFQILTIGIHQFLDYKDGYIKDSDLWDDDDCWAIVVMKSPILIPSELAPQDRSPYERALNKKVDLIGQAWQATQALVATSQK